MEIITLENDITVICKTASSFPEGVLEAHQSLHALVPYTEKRKYFGLSRPEQGTIIYKAAAEELNPLEAQKPGLTTMVLPKGRYISLTVNDYMKNISGIEEAFKKLIARPDIDPQGYCVEWYLNDKDLKCMVRLAY